MNIYIYMYTHTHIYIFEYTGINTCKSINEEVPFLHRMIYIYIYIYIHMCKHIWWWFMKHIMCRYMYDQNQWTQRYVTTSTYKSSLSANIFLLTDNTVVRFMIFFTTFTYSIWIFNKLMHWMSVFLSHFFYVWFQDSISIL